MRTIGNTVLVVFLAIAYSTRVSGIRCLECTDSPHPFSCSTVTTCSAGDQCYVEQYVTSGGLVLYKTGCMSTLRCAAPKRDLLLQASRKRAGDLLMCIECCKDEFCNDQGCGQTAIKQPNRGPACFKCDAQAGQDTCRDFTDCDINDVCFLKKTNAFATETWVSGCIQKQQCEALRNNSGSTDVDHCPLCCSTDYCNDKCIEVPPQSSISTSLTSTIPSSTASSSTKPSTTVSNSTSTKTTNASTVVIDLPSATPPQMSSTLISMSSSLHTDVPSSYPTVASTLSTNNTTTNLPSSLMTSAITSVKTSIVSTESTTPKAFTSTASTSRPSSFSTAGPSSSKATTVLWSPSTTLSHSSIKASVTPASSTSKSSSFLPLSSKTSTAKPSISHTIPPSITITPTSNAPTTVSTPSTSAAFTSTSPTMPGSGTYSECKSADVDLVFVLDNSNAGHTSRWYYERKLIKDFVSRFDIDHGSTRVALVLYNTYVHAVIKLNDNVTTSKLCDAIDIQPLANNDAHLDKALDLVNTNVIDHNTNRTTYVIVLARQQFSIPEATNAANKIKANPGVTLIAASYQTWHSDNTALNAIASYPSAVISGISVTHTNKEEHAIDEFVSIICSNPACVDLPKSICFVLDSSGSMTPLEFHKQLEFVMMVVSDLHIGYGAPTEVCVITYSTTASLQIRLTTGGHLTKQLFSAQLFNITYSPGETETDKGLLLAFKVLEHSHKNDKTIVVLTDGRSTYPQLTKNVVDYIRTKDSAVDTIAVGIGDNIDRSELDMIASDPNKVFTVSNFNILDTIHSQVVSKLCSDCSKEVMKCC